MLFIATVPFLLFVFLLARRWWRNYLTWFHAQARDRRRALLKELGWGAKEANTKVMGYFHPYCNLGGGGERVLWAAIQHMQHTQPHIVNAVYTGDLDASKDQIIQKVKKGWDITLDPNSLHFVYLTRRKWVEDKTWPQFTLAGQSIGSMYLAWEAMSKLIPDLYIDTMGYAFTYPIVSLLTRSPSPSTTSSSSASPLSSLPIPIGTYTHYPIISSTMLNRVRMRTASPTNPSLITRSSILSSLKLVYLRLFTYYYGLAMRNAQFVMVNSSWTKRHVDEVLSISSPSSASSPGTEDTKDSGGATDWIGEHLHSIPVTPFYLFRHFFRNGGHGRRRPPASISKIVYPPCETREIGKFPLEGRERVIVSLAQFRPEKDQPLQIRSFCEFLRRHPEMDDVRLVQIGGASRKADKERVEGLKRMVKELGVEDKVQFIVNAPYTEVIQWLRKASIGVSTMVDEHFGINIVEYMAAGLIPITNASGGPYLDIAIPHPTSRLPTGFHCKTEVEYADAFWEVFRMDKGEEIEMRKRARAWAVQAFSEEGFVRSWDESGWKEWMEV